MYLRTLAVAGATALATCGLPTSAHAAQTEASELKCPGTTVSVTGFGRGEVMHVVGSNANFVVTSAVNAAGQTLIDVPGQRDRSRIVTCTTTSPWGTDYTFEGFFTPVDRNAS